MWVKSRFKKKPPEVWLSSRYYCGSIAEDLYPFWREKFVEVVNGQYSEVILYGSIGGGKTYFANVLLIWKLYELACLGEEVWEWLGLAKGSPVYFLYFSVTREQAKHTGFQEFLNLVDGIPWFQENFPRDRSVNSVARFPNGIVVLSGSKFQHQLGMNVLGAVLDEANFRLEKEAFEYVSRLYETVTIRRLSRFLTKDRDPGLSILISSARDASSFVEDRIRRKRGDPRTVVISVVGYDVKRERFSEREFVVFVGKGYLAPRLVESVEELRDICRLAGFNWSDEWGVHSPHYVVKNLMSEEERRYFRFVPVELKDAFKGSDFVRAVRDILGVEVADENKLMRSVKAYEECIDNGMRNAFVKDVVALSSFDDVRLQEYFDFSVLRDLDRQRFIHVDLGLRKDRTGIACAYVGDVKRDEEGRLLPVVYVDFIVGLEKDVSKRLDDEIPLWKIRDFLFWLREKGLFISKISFDRFASEDMIQLLRRGGFNVERLSVDRDDSIYLNLVQLYLERRLKHFEHQLFRRELFELEWDKERRKVDHPVGGTKDIVDAVAGAVYWASRETRLDYYALSEYVDLKKKVDGWEEFFRVIQLQKDRGRRGWFGR